MTTKKPNRVQRAEAAVRVQQNRRDRAWRELKQALDHFETCVAALQEAHTKLERATDDANLEEGPGT